MNKKQKIHFLLAGLAGALIIFTPLPVRASLPAQRTIRIEASQFAYSPGTFQVNPGDTVTIELVSKDVVHGFYLDGYGISVTADPGQTARLTFTADKTGSFRFRCSMPCGALHPFMIGKLQVGPDTQLWRAVSLAGLGVLAVLSLRPGMARVETG